MSEGAPAGGRRSAIDEIASELPFPLLGLDSDNGSEFINMHLYRDCTKRAITFTRARPYRKNDNCYVEQKNWPVVRKQVGYARYDTPERPCLAGFTKSTLACSSPG